MSLQKRQFEGDALVFRRSDKLVSSARLPWMPVPSSMDDLATLSSGMSASIVVKDARNEGSSGPSRQREQYLHNFLCPDPAVKVLIDHDKLLGIGQSDRDHHPSTKYLALFAEKRPEVTARISR